MIAATHATSHEPGMGPGMADLHAMQASIAAAMDSRFRRARKGLPSAGAGADWHIRDAFQFFKLIELARDIDANDPVIGQIITRAVDNMLQGGLPVNPTTGVEALDDKLRDNWRDYIDSPDRCDATGESDFTALQWRAMRQSIVDGDHFGVILDSGAVQQIEAHRIRTPKSQAGSATIHGVEVNPVGQRLRYWMVTQEPKRWDREIREEQFVNYAARNEAGERLVLQIYDPHRAMQVRGITALLPLVDLATYFQDITFATLIRAQVSACFAMMIERENSFAGLASTKLGQQTSTDENGFTRVTESLSPGMIFRGQPGEKLSGFSPNIPNPEFFPFTKLIVTLIGINLGLPLVMALMDASETNFSGYRGAVDQARLSFRRRQKLLGQQYITPIYRFTARRFIESSPALVKLSKRSRNPLAHTITPAAWPYIEPIKDATGDKIRVDNNLISPRRLHAERGREHIEIINETVEDNGYAIERAMAKAQQINAQFPAQPPAHWRQFLNLNEPVSIEQALAIANDGGTPRTSPGAPTTRENPA